MGQEAQPNIDVIDMLQHIGQGVCVVRHDDTCLWASDSLTEDKVGDLLEHVIRVAAQAIRTQAAKGGKRVHAGASYEIPIREKCYQVWLTPYTYNAQEDVETVVVTVRDMTESYQHSKRLAAVEAAGQRIERMGKEMVQSMNPSQRLKLVQDRFGSAIRDVLGYEWFIVRLSDPASGKLEVAICEGFPESAQDIDIYPESEGNGITGYVAATGRSYICSDVEKDDLYTQGVSHARSSLTVPVRCGSRIIGACDIESAAIDAFTDRDRELAESLCEYLGAALNVLALLVAERTATCGQVAKGVIDELRQGWRDAQTEIAALNASATDDQLLILASLSKHLNTLDEMANALREGPAVVMGAFLLEEDHASPLMGIRVLVADDDERVRAGVLQVLERLGCSVTLASDGYQAAIALERQSYDLVLSDIRMPYRNGYEIYAAAQRAKVGLPVILMTGFGYDPNHSIVRANQEGLTCVLFKPFEAVRLIDEIGKALDKEEEMQPYLQQSTEEASE